VTAFYQSIMLYSESVCASERHLIQDRRRQLANPGLLDCVCIYQEGQSCYSFAIFST